MKWKFFALFATLAVILVIVSTINIVTLFQGSHNMVNISASGNDINCEDCHSRIQDQFNSSAIHSGFKCEECHRITQTANGKEIDYAKHNSSGIFIGNQSHAAYTPRCLDCHGSNGIYYNDTGVAKIAPPAPAFNKSDYGTNYSAHKNLVERSLNYNLSVGENEACIACHTNFSVEVKHSYFWNINYSISYWSISSFSYNGTRDYEVDFNKTGAKHEFVNASSISCTGCHKNIYEALVNGTYSSEHEDYLTHAPIEINSGVDGTSWGTANDCWGNSRYHYESNRAEDVNTEYCTECHNVDRFAEEHSTQASTYSLSSVTGDTNSTQVHAAEALNCGTCHGNGTTKEPTCSDHSADDFVEHVKNNYARTFVGDICMGCHEAAVHPNSMGGQGCPCHTSQTVVDSVNIESEPPGVSCNSRGVSCPAGPEAYFNFSPDYPEPGQSVSFDASGSSDPDGTIDSYKWEFGDGNTTTVSDPTINHTYSSAGNYTVNLTVTDNDGLKDTYTDVVEVTSAPKSWVYQEDANVTSCSSGWLLSQPCSNTYDGDWSTYGTQDDSPYVTFNYTKPSGATDAKWKVKDQGATTNLTIPSSCWDYYADKLAFKADCAGGWYPETNWYCYNGSWNKLRTDDDDNIYEEGIWWYK